MEAVKEARVILLDEAFHHYPNIILANSQASGARIDKPAPYSFRPKRDPSASPERRTPKPAYSQNSRSYTRLPNYNPRDRSPSQDRFDNRRNKNFRQSTPGYNRARSGSIDSYRPDYNSKDRHRDYSRSYDRDNRSNRNRDNRNNRGSRGLSNERRPRDCVHFVLHEKNKSDEYSSSDSEDAYFVPNSLTCL